MKPRFVASAKTLLGAFLVAHLLTSSGCTPDSSETTTNNVQASASDAAAANGGGSTAATPAVPTVNSVTPTATTTAPSSPATSTPAAGNASETSSQCAELVANAQRLGEGIPRKFLELKRPLRDIEADLEKCLQLCSQYVASCPEAATNCSMQVLHGRLLLANFRRYHQSLTRNEETKARVPQLASQYLNNVRDIVDKAVECSAPKSAQRVDALRVYLEVLDRLADTEGVRRIADQIIAEYPDYEFLSDLHFKKGRAYLKVGQYEACEDYMRKVVQQWGHADDLVIFNIVLFEALLGQADLDGVEQLMETIYIEYPLRRESVESRYLRNQYDQWRNIAKFWIGYCRFARGDVAGARQAFEQHRDECGNISAERVAQGKDLDPVVKVTLQHRTMPHLSFIEEALGTAPKVEMNFGNMWATEETMTLEESRGDVVVLVFRPPGDARSAGFLEGVGKLIEQKKDRGLRAAWVSYILNERDETANQTRKQAMLTELDRFGISIPSGYDPDTQRQGFFRACRANVGSAHCVVLDRAGALAYFLADPREVDLKLLTRVTDRLLDQG